MVLMARTAALTTFGVVLLVAACAAPPPSSDFSSPDSASRIASIEKAVQDRDAARVRQIVELLDSDDPAVRLVAITALETLTGQTNGYHYDDPPSARKSAVERWVVFVNRTRPDMITADG